MDNKNLFKEAIADAKAVREAALANAKAALEEALTPKLQSMLATKLQEMEYEEEAMGKEDDMEEGFITNQFNFSDEDNSDTDQNTLDESDDDLEEDFDLSEILAELEDEDENLNEAKKEDDDEDEKESETETEEVADMTVEDLKALIKDIVSQEMSSGEEMHDEPDADNAGGPSDNDADNADDEINLDELLAELDALGENEDENEMNELFGFGKKKEQPSSDKSSQSQKTCPEGQAKWQDGKCYPVMEDDYHSTKQIPRLENGHIIVANQIWSMEEGKKSKHEKGETKAQEKAEHASGKEKKEKSEMKEAIDTINALRSELNEVNLLNAKLLYVNKIFKAKNLSESQKLKVIASFDKATTAKEAKVVYESLNSTLTAAAPKQAIKESLGFASKAAGTAPRKAIVETNDAITRMQKLANIIK